MMQQRLLAWLKKPYGIVTGCALCTGITVGTIEDLRHWAISQTLALFSTPVSTEQACVGSYLDARPETKEGPYLIIMTNLVNDTDQTQTRSLDQNLRSLYGQDIGGAIQLEAMPCTIYPISGNAADRYQTAKQTALNIAMRAKADVVIWGEVVKSGQKINLSMTHPRDSTSHDYTVQDDTLDANFGGDIGALIAAKMLTLVEVSAEDAGNFLVDRMQRVEALTGPLIADLPPQMTPSDLAELYYSNGTALFYSGRQSGDLAKVRAASVAFEAALAQYPSETADGAWAGLQVSYGNALQILGSFDQAPDNLYAAKDAYQKALQVYSRQANPSEWAGVQNNLGITLQTLSKRPEGGGVLDEAVTAFKAALEVYTKESAPLEWAMVENNLGSTLQVLGEQTPGTALLTDAVTALRAALTERTKDRVPVNWATTQHNLGIALQILGQRENSDQMLKDAVAAFEAALTVRSRDTLPRDWAMTQNDLGNTLSILAERQQADDLQERAVAAYRASLEVNTQADTPIQWAMTQDNLGIALTDLGRREPGMARLTEAEAAFHAALSIRTRDQFPLNWATTTLNLAMLTYAQFDKTADPTLLASASDLVSQARDVFVAAGAGQYVGIADAVLAEITNRQSP